MTATAGEGYVAKADDGYRTRRGPIVEELAHSDGGQPTIQNEKRVLLDVHGAITFRWPTLRRNDCTMTEAELHLASLLHNKHRAATDIPQWLFRSGVGSKGASGCDCFAPKSGECRIGDPSSSQP